MQEILKKCNFSKENEEKRLKALYEYKLDEINLDGQLDLITRLLAIICNTPISVVSIVDKTKVFIKSAIGMEKIIIERDITYCDHVVAQDDLFEVCDAFFDDRFKNNPFTFANPPVIFYAGMPLKTPSGANIGVLCVVDHIPRKLNSDQRQALVTLAHQVVLHLELQKYNHELILANKKTIELGRAKEEFLSNVSHEIRTPLNAIYGFTELLNQTAINKEQQEMLNIIRSSVDILMMIINDILDLSKIESGKLTIEKHPYNLSQEFKSLQEIFSQKAKEKHLSLNFKFDKKIPKIINGDKTRINQILINLIGNALKFTNKGSIEVSINLVEDNENQVGLNFCVKDSGIGIPEDKINLIFDRFEQASSDTTRKYGGTGLGLSICKSLVELQGGQLILDSKFGLGSSFSFTLFFDRLKDEEIAKILEEDKKNKKLKKLENCNEKEQFNQSLKKLSKKDKLNFLVCEDTLFNYKLIEKILEDTVVNIDLAENGKEGIDKFKKKQYDLVLLDLQMPIMNGFDFANILRNHMNSDALIIAMTASNSQLEKEQCYKLGINNYLSKPFRQNKFLNKIIYTFQKRKSESSYNDTHKNSKSITSVNKNEQDVSLMENKTKNILIDGNYEVYKTSFSLLKSNKDNRCHKFHNGKISKKKLSDEENQIKNLVSNAGSVENFMEFQEKEELLYIQNTCDDIKAFSIQVNNGANIYNGKKSIVENKKFPDSNFEESEIFNLGTNKQFLDIDSYFSGEIKIDFYKMLNKSQNLTKEDIKYGDVNDKYIQNLILDISNSESKLKSLNSSFIINRNDIDDPHNKGSYIEKEDNSEYDADFSLKNDCKDFIKKSSNLMDGEFSKSLESSSIFSNEEVNICNNKHSNNENFIKYTKKSTFSELQLFDYTTKRSKSKQPSQMSEIKINNMYKDRCLYLPKLKRVYSWKPKNFSPKMKNKTRSKFQKSSNIYIEDLIKNKSPKYKSETELELVVFDIEKEESDLFTEKEFNSITVNFECLNEISGGDYIFEKDLISIFLNEFPIKIHNLKISLEKEEFKEIQILSHSLKSIVAMFGIETLRKMFSELENAVKISPINTHAIKKFKDFINVLGKVYVKLKQIFCEKYKDINIKVNNLL